MSLETIRTDIVTAVEARRATFSGGYTLVVEYDNVLLVDTRTQTNPYLCVEIKFIQGKQADLSNAPLQRVYGQLLLSAAVPEGSGSSRALILLDYFALGLQRRAFGTVRTHVSSPSQSRPHLGWVYFTISLPFWSDQST